MKRILVISMMLLLLAVALVSCGNPVETTESSPSPEANITPSTTTAEQVYYFQTVDNFVELEYQSSSYSEYFRHDEGAYGREGPPSVKILATIPSFVTIEGTSYEVAANYKEKYGRTIKYELKDVETSDRSGQPFVLFDVLNGQLVGFDNWRIRDFTDEEKKTDPEVLARGLVAEYLPHISMEGYEVFQNTIIDKQYDAHTWASYPSENM